MSKKNLVKKSINLKKWLSNLKNNLPTIITILLLLFIWLYKERQNNEELLDEMLELNNDSKLIHYLKLIRNKIINLVTFIFIPALLIVYNLGDTHLVRQLIQFSQDNFVVNFFANLFDLFTNSAENDQDESEQNDEMQSNFDEHSETTSFDIQNLRLEFKKDIKQMKKTIDTLTQDNQKFLNVTNRNQTKNQLRLETFEKKVVELINDELSRLKDALLDKMNHFQQKYSFLEPANYEKFCEMFETADVTVDLIRKRDQQLKDLFKITTEIILKSELVDDDLKNMSKAYSDLVEETKLKYQDLSRYIDDFKQATEDSLTNKFKSDQIKVFNEIENLRAEIDLKEKNFARLSSMISNAEQNINSVKKRFAEYDDKIRHCTKEIDDFRDKTDNLTIYLNTDVTGKINGILRFLGKSELDDKG